MIDQRIRITRAWIPNAVTAFSVFLGYLAIIATFEHNFVTAAWLIVFAGILDLFDGRLARAVGGTSKFGTYFDSLADAINYGVAPSLLFYQLYFVHWSFIGAAFTFLPTVCGAIRLARFGVLTEETGKSSFFMGLPTTVAAGFLASYVIFMHDVFGGFGTDLVAAVFLALASVLMISAVPYEHNSIITDRPLHKNWKAVLLLVALATIAILSGRVLFVWIALYVGYGLVRSILQTARDIERKASL